MMKAYAQPRSGGAPSTSKTADDKAYTAWAKSQAAAAGVRNPGAYVNKNVAQNAGPASRSRVMGQINRQG